MDPEAPVMWEAKKAPSIALVRSRYRREGLFDWNTQRVNILCRQIKCGVYEVCAAAGQFDIAAIDRYIESDRWPVWLAIHLRRLEDQVHRMKFAMERPTGPGPDDVAFAELIERAKKK